MTDIVEWLENFASTRLAGSDSQALAKDAKAEIERLRTRLALAETSIECFETDRVEAQAEIERLRNDHDFDARRWVEVHKEAQAEIERLRQALHRIRSWSAAYPLDIFPEPDFKRARALLEAGGITLDAVAASCMRRCVEGIGKIARGALETDNARD